MTVLIVQNTRNNAVGGSVYFYDAAGNPLHTQAISLVPQGAPGPEHGYDPPATFTVLFSLAPTYLKFQKHNRATYAVVISASAAQVLLLLWLVPVFGATGAAGAYAFSMCGMYAAFAMMAHREVVALKRAAATGEWPEKATKGA